METCIFCYREERGAEDLWICSGCVQSLCQLTADELHDLCEKFAAHGCVDKAHAIQQVFKLKGENYGEAITGCNIGRGDQRDPGGQHVRSIKAKGQTRVSIRSIRKRTKGVSRRSGKTMVNRT